MNECHRCGQVATNTRRLFCENCGAVLDRGALKRVRLMGPIGVLNSNSPKIAEFWETGDPEVFDRK